MTRENLIENRKDLTKFLIKHNIKRMNMNNEEWCYICMNLYDRETFDNIMLNHLLLEKLKKVYNNVEEKEINKNTYSVVYIIKDTIE